MPRENVYSDDTPYATEEGDPLARSVVTLTWSKDHDTVQIVTQCVNLSDGGVYEEAPEEDLAGQRIPRAYGNYVTLDRAGINRLVRNLRRARDQAFGRDE